MKHKFGIILWIFGILLGFLVYFYNKAYFDKQLWVDISENYLLLLSVYFLLSLLRGFFLLPVTPLLLVGVIFLKPLEYILISVFGIMFGALLIYYFSDFFGFDKYFQSTKYKKQIEKTQKYLSGKYGYYVFASWTIIPVVPNVVISYVGGVLRVPIKIYFFGTLTGAILETLFYLFFKGILT